jgi:hypothetical protein
LRQQENVRKLKGCQERLWEAVAVKINFIVNEVQLYGKKPVAKEVDQKVISDVLKALRSLNRQLIRLDKHRSIRKAYHFLERRSGQDRRKGHDPAFFIQGGVERRGSMEYRPGVDRTNYVNPGDNENLHDG